MEKNGELGLTGGSLKIRIIRGLSEEAAEKGEIDRQPKMLSQTDQGCRPIAYQYKKGHPSSFDGAPFFHSEQLIKLQKHLPLKHLFSLALCQR